MHIFLKNSANHSKIIKICEYSKFNYRNLRGEYDFNPPIKKYHKKRKVKIMSNKNEILVNKADKLVDVENIYQDIRNKIIIAREKMFKHIDTTMTEVYWYVGKITYELSESSTKASYGKRIIEALSSKLTNEFGSGFSSVSIRRMRRFYEMYPIWLAVPTELSWSHFQELIKVDRKEYKGKIYK